jgi:hypothetical protein
MTSPTKSYRRQAGVTMLLAILVLSAITAVSFSLATIMFIELRSSGDVFRTEPTLYASEAITEEAIFKIKRSAPVNYATCIPAATPCTGSVLDNPPPTVQLYGGSPLVEVISPSSTKQHQIVNPNDVFGGAGYGKLIVTFLNAGPGLSVNVSVDQIDPISGTRTSAGSTTLSTNSPWTLALQSTYQYELNVQDSNATTSATVAIDTYAPDGVTRQGLPYIGQTVLDIIASYAGLTRKYEVKIPNY